jgi:hypothetical protein
MTEGAEPASPARGEAISAASALALLVAMFAFEWFGTAGVPGSATRAANSGAEDAWTGLTDLRWLMLATVAVVLGSSVLHLSQRAHGTQTHTGTAVTVLGALTAALLVYRVFVSFPSPAVVVDQKLGAVLGVFSALGIALGGFEALRAERARGRRLEQRARARHRVARAPAER